MLRHFFSFCSAKFSDGLSFGYRSCEVEPAPLKCLVMYRKVVSESLKDFSFKFRMIAFRDV